MTEGQPSPCWLNARPESEVGDVGAVHPVLIPSLKKQPQRNVLGFEQVFSIE